MGHPSEGAGGRGGDANSTISETTITMISFAHSATALVSDVTNTAMLQTQSMQMRDEDDTIVRTPKLAHFGNNFGTFRHANFGIIGRNSIFMFYTR